jgi:hypothetical protein
MRRTILALAVLAVWLAPALTAHAGLYNRVDRETINRAYLLGPGMDKLKELLVQLRESRVRELKLERGSYKSLYEQEAQRLEKKLHDGSLTTLERAELGAYYIRLNRAEEARDLLEAGDKTHFLILLHLAEAYHELSLTLSPRLLLRAVSYQQQALEHWPAVWAQWTGWEWGFYRRAEQLYLKLLNLRLAESGARRASRDGPGLDPLFPDVRLVGPSGEYEAGNIKQEEIDKLPDTAYQQVLQLTLWRPHDDRLVWLLAEMIHIGGRIDIAWDLMEYIYKSSKLSSWRMLRVHRQILFDKARVMKKLRADNQALFHQLVSWATPRGPGQGSVGGGVSEEMCRWVPTLLPELSRQQFSGAFPGPGTKQPSDPAPAPKPWFDWRPLAVGFGSGLAVALLAGLQWQEWRRRRHLARQAAEAEAEAEA